MSEWQKVETGTDEQGEPTFEYQFGGKIDGVFVPAVTKSATYIEHLHERGKAAQDAQASESGTGSGKSSKEQQ